MTDLELDKFYYKYMERGFEITAYETYILCNGTRIAGLRAQKSDPMPSYAYLTVYEGLDQGRQREVYERLVRYLNDNT